MALLNPAETISAAPRRATVALNWRLMLAIGCTAVFWIGVARAVASVA